MKFLLAIDQGTTSTRAVLFDRRGRAVSCARREITQHFPQPGRVEHDASEILDSVRTTGREAMREAGCGAGDIIALGITNQRETIVAWDRRDGRPVAPAIVWQDRRTAGDLAALRAAGHEPLIRRRSGLLPDPYFSASKLSWILREVPGAADLAASGRLAAGTIESWLIWNLTGGREHLTDVTNASRTMLMDIRRGVWDAGLLALFGIPAGILPRIVPTSGDLGVAEPAMFGAPVPIRGAIGDQQAALFGQLCTEPGMVKCTYGTGCFMLLFTGADAVDSRHRLLTTVAWQIGGGPRQYALEGSVFDGGSAIQWLRDGLRLIRSSSEVGPLAGQAGDSGGVAFVPAFSGLGAPHWDPDARGAILGLTRGTSAAQIARAALEGIAHQAADLLAAMRKDAARPIPMLRVDGGAAACDVLMQIQADLAGVPIDRPRDVETTALGAAMMAGLGAGVWRDAAELAAVRGTDTVFRPQSTPASRREARRTWRRAVRRARRWNVGA